MGSGPPGGSWMTVVAAECADRMPSPRVLPLQSRAVAFQGSSGGSRGPPRNQLGAFVQHRENSEAWRPGAGVRSRGSGHLTCAEHGAALPFPPASMGNGDTLEKGLKRLF